MKYNIAINWDDEAGVWCAVCDEIPMAIESNSLDALLVKAKIVALDILESNNELSGDIKLCFNAFHEERVANG